MSVFGFLLSALVFRLFPKSLNFEYFFSLWIAFLILHLCLALGLSMGKKPYFKKFFISALRGAFLFGTATYLLLVGFMCYYFDLPINGRLVSPEIHTGFGSLVFLGLTLLATLFIVMGFRYRDGRKRQKL